MIQRPPFTRTRTDEERSLDKSNVYTIRLNKEEENKIKEAGVYFQQPKLSTLIKQLALLNADDVLHDKKTRDRLLVVMNNCRRNWETGVPVDMPSDKEILGNVTPNND